MDRIDRRNFVKVAGAGGAALAVSATHGMLAANEARAQQRAGAWPNRRLLDLLKIEHPIVQAPMGGHVSPDMPVAVSEAGGAHSPAVCRRRRKCPMKSPRAAPKPRSR